MPCQCPSRYTKISHDDTASAVSGFVETQFKIAVSPTMDTALLVGCVDFHSATLLVFSRTVAAAARTCRNIAALSVTLPSSLTDRYSGRSNQSMNSASPFCSAVPQALSALTAAAAVFGSGAFSLRDCGLKSCAVAGPIINK